MSSTTPRPSYSEEIREAVKKARYDVLGRKPGRDREKHIPGPSAGQHVRVRERVTAMLDGKPTPDGIIKLAGVKSLTALRKIAESQPDTDPAPLRTLSAEFKGDQWAMGRNLAAILVVWVEELKS